MVQLSVESRSPSPLAPAQAPCRLPIGRRQARFQWEGRDVQFSARDGGQAQQVDPPAVGIEHTEAIGADFSDFVAFWQVAKRTHH